MSERPDLTNPEPEFKEDELRWAAQNLPKIRAWSQDAVFSIRP
jgi:hypothetical protein